MHSLTKNSAKQQEICLNLKSNDNSAQSTVQINSYAADITNDNHYLLVPIYLLSLDASALSKLMLAQFIELIKNNKDINLTHASLKSMFNVSERSVQRAFKDLKELNLICITEQLNKHTKNFGIKVNFERLEEVRQEAIQKHSFFTETSVDQCLSIPKFSIKAADKLDVVMTAAFLMIFDNYYMRRTTLEGIVGTHQYTTKKVLRVALDVGVMRKVESQIKDREEFKIDHCPIKQRAFFDRLVSPKTAVSNASKKSDPDNIENPSSKRSRSCKTVLDRTLEKDCKASLNKASRKNNVNKSKDDLLEVSEENNPDNTINAYKDLNTYKNLTNYACAKKLDSYELAEISDAVKASTERIISNEVLQDDAVVTMQTLAEAFAVNPLHEQMRNLLHDNPTIQDDKYQPRYHRALLNVIADSHEAPLRAIRYHEARDYIHRTAGKIASHSSWSPSLDYHEFESIVERSKPMDYSLKVTAKELKYVVTEVGVPEIFVNMIDTENEDRPRHKGYELGGRTMHNFLNYYCDCSNAPKTIEQFVWAFNDWCERENGRMMVA